MSGPPLRSARRRWLDRLWVAGGALATTLACFLILPVMQAIARGPSTELIVLDVDTAQLPPPPPPPIEPEPEPEEEPPAPELEERVQPLDLAQLELALNPGIGEGWLSGDFSLKLDGLGAGDDVQELFELASLDQQPRLLHQAQPVMTPKLRDKAPGAVVVIFLVDAEGRVESPTVQSSDDPVFERAALEAIQKWKFEPGRVNGRPVKSRVRVTIQFPKA